MDEHTGGSAPGFGGALGGGTLSTIGQPEKIRDIVAAPLSRVCVSSTLWEIMAPERHTVPRASGKMKSPSKLSATPRKGKLELKTADY